jgi:serine/threonine-protein kinase
MGGLVLNEEELFAGRYRILRSIAIGGMGAVYEVIHLETERRRALKVMLPHLAESEALRERFRREARVAAQIDSAFIVDVFDAGIDEPTGIPFLVMELLRGEELGKRIKRAGRLDAGEALVYLWQTALALDKTHRVNIVHRDLKPENLFLAEQDDGPPKIKVLDFGIAKFVAEGSTHGAATQSVGTPLYMAPEQCRTGSPVWPATDIFALAMISYTLLVGVPYWREEQSAGGNVFAFLATVMTGPQEPATARARRRGVVLPEAYDAWFATATAPDPKSRFSTATSAISALADALGLPRPGEPARREPLVSADSANTLGSAPISKEPSSVTVLMHTATPVPVHDSNRNGASTHLLAPVGAVDTMVGAASGSATSASFSEPVLPPTSPRRSVVMVAVGVILAAVAALSFGFIAAKGNGQPAANGARLPSTQAASSVPAKPSSERLVDGERVTSPPASATDAGARAPVSASAAEPALAPRAPTVVVSAKAVGPGTTSPSQVGNSKPRARTSEHERD